VTRVPDAAARVVALAATLAVLALPSCAKAPRAPDVTAARPGVPVDSATVALWHMDDPGGTRAADSGPSRLDAVAGDDTRSIFGRFGSARLFTLSSNSFLYVPPSPVLDLPSAITIEAWVAPNAYSRHEDAVIAARWSPTTTEQSWVFAIVGTNAPVDLNGPLAPGWHRAYVQTAQPGQLMFLFQPEQAGAPRAYFSLSSIELQRWTHVAVTFDGQVVSFWVDGRVDGVFASTGRIRSSQAPLLVGNFFDTRTLTDFGGDLRQAPEADTTPWYALDGGMDELRLSRVARARFPLRAGR
jgi:hypothetical protein